MNTAMPLDSEICARVFKIFACTASGKWTSHHPMYFVLDEMTDMIREVYPMESYASPTLFLGFADMFAAINQQEGR